MGLLFKEKEKKIHLPLISSLIEKHWRASHAIRKCNGSSSFDPFVIITGRMQKKGGGGDLFFFHLEVRTGKATATPTASVSISHLTFLSSYVLAVSEGVEKSLFSSSSSSSLINSPIHFAAP